MQNYYFILGRENKISQKELEAVLASFDFGLRNDSVSIIAEDILEIKLNVLSSEVADLMNILGGTVKIYQKIASSNEKIETLLAKESISKKIIFGLSNYSSTTVDTFRLALSAKKALKKSIRIVDGKDAGRLSSAQSFQYRMDCGNIEYGIFDTPSRPRPVSAGPIPDGRAEAGGIGKLIAVQNINEWSRHDCGKPRSDARSGMLPPKLARMMVNLAVSQIPLTKLQIEQKYEITNNNLSRPLIVDPFCGSGNVLIEALTIGCDVVGSDISEKAVSDTKANLEWLAESGKWKVERADATKFNFGSINENFVIVSEPYLGEPRKRKLRIEEEKEVKENIRKMYLNFLQNLKLTADSSKLKAVCLVFPLFELANGKKLSIFNECIDFIGQIGYDIVCPPCSGETSSCKAGPPMEYGRDYQVVKREIVLLRQQSPIINHQ